MARPILVIIFWLISSDAVIVSLPSSNSFESVTDSEKTVPNLMRTDSRPSRMQLTAGGVLRPLEEADMPLADGKQQSNVSRTDIAAPWFHHLDHGEPLPSPTAQLPSPYQFLKGWDFHQHKAFIKDCGSNLSGIGNDAVLEAIGHHRIQAPQTSSFELALLQSRSFFIAAHLHAAATVLPHWTLEIVRLLMALRKGNKEGVVDNLFVSIVESSSSVESRKYMEYLEGHLHFLGVPFTVVRGQIAQTVNFLAKARNKALEPLRASPSAYDQVIFLEAHYFCADAALQASFTALPIALGGLGADAVCGLSYKHTRDAEGSKCAFVGTRETRDIVGQPFQETKPVAGVSEDDYDLNRPFQVFSCWNGLVVLAADVFQKQQLIFRASRASLNECPTSESELFFRDMWKIGRGKVVLLPSASTGLTPHAFQRCALRRQWTVFNQTPPLDFGVAPDTVSCCPLSPNDFDKKLDFSKCNAELWDRFGKKVPRYQHSHLSTLNVDGDLTFLISQALSAESEMSAEGANARLALVFAALFLVGVMVERFRHGLGGNSFAVLLVLCGLSSVAMHIVNKNAVSLLPLPYSLVALQMMIADALLLATFGRSLVLELVNSMDSVKRWSLLTLPYVCLLVTTMLALRKEAGATLMMVVRSVLPMVSIALEQFLCSQNREKVTVQSCLALYCIALGTLILTLFDLELDESLGMICLSSVFALLYRFSQRHLLLDPDMRLSCPAMSLVSNLAGLILVLPLCFINGEHHLWYSPRLWSLLLDDFTDWGCILLSGCIAATLGYYTLMVQKRISATSMLVLQMTSKMVLITLALVMLSARWYWSSLVGCLITLVGCAWFLKANICEEIFSDLRTTKLEVKHETPSQ